MQTFFKFENITHETGKWTAACVYLAALDQLLVSRLVLVGRGSVLSCSDGLSGCGRCLLSCILQTNTYTSLDFSEDIFSCQLANSREN